VVKKLLPFLLAQAGAKTEREPIVNDEQRNAGQSGDLSAQQLVPLTGTSAAPVAYKDADQGLIKVAGVLVAIASLISGPVGAALVSLTTLVALFVPDILNSFSNVSGKIENDLIGSINTVSLEHAIAQAQASQNGFSLKFSRIERYFDEWENGTTDLIKNNALTGLRQAYWDITLNTLPEMTKNFTHANFGGFLIPQYAATGASYLAIMRSYYLHADALQLENASGRSERQDLVLKHLKHDLQSMVDTAINSYRLGVKNIINNTSGYKRSWDDYNNYRNHATLAGLDLIAAFQYADPELYPRGCHTRNLNRRLLTYLDTSGNAGAALQYRSNVMEIEKKFNPFEGVMSLQKMRMFYGSFPVLGKHVDGMYGVECTTQSHDGFSLIFQEPYSGLQRPPQIPEHYHEIEAALPCAEFEGRYRKPTDLNVGLMHTTIASMRATSKGIGANPPIAYYDAIFNSSAINESNSAAYLQHLPARSASQSNAENILSERLAQLRIDFNQSEGHHNYLYYWHNRTVLDELLPEKSHQT